MRRWRICRLAAAFENLDDDHAAAAAGARAGQDARLIGGSGLGLFMVNDAWGSTEQLACACDVGGAVAAGKQSIVADAVEAFGQDVGEEPANELVGVQCHRLPPVGSVNAVILPAEGDAVVVGGDQTTIGDGDAVGIPGLIAQYLLGPGEGVFGVDDPL